MTDFLDLTGKVIPECDACTKRPANLAPHYNREHGIAVCCACSNHDPHDCADVIDLTAGGHYVTDPGTPKEPEKLNAEGRRLMMALGADPDKIDYQLFLIHEKWVKDCEDEDRWDASLL